MAIRWGNLCSACRDGKCEDAPTEMEPVHLRGVTCLQCGGSGEADGLRCTACRGSGKETITACPQSLATREAWSTIAAADFARKGVLPYAGGYMDQPHWLMEGIRFVWDLEEPIRQKLKMNVE